MGMFDSIKCEYPLPLPLDVIDLNLDLYDSEFQTKDLDNIMSTFFLTEEGRLIEEVVEREWVGDENTLFKGYMKTVSTRMEDTNFHGVLKFYCCEDVEIEGKIFFLDLTYLGKFTDGALESLDILEYSIDDITQSRLESEQHMKELLKRRECPLNKYFFNTKPVLFVRRRIIYNFFDKFYRFASYLRSLAIRYL